MVCPSAHPISSRRPSQLTRPVLAQGCCFSRPSGPNAPVPGAASIRSPQRTNSSRAANHPPPPSSAAALPLSQASPSRTHRRRSRRPLDQHINKPLRRHHWASLSPSATSTTAPRTWTRPALDAERAAFFDTRVTGRPEVWQGIRAALEVLWEAERGGAGSDFSDSAVEEGDGDLALATAQSILDAADVTLPTGNLVDGAYDLLGNYYQLAEAVVCDPVDVEEEGVGAVDGGEKDGGEVEEEDEEEREARRRREEKGKSVVDRRALVTVVIRMSNTGRDLRLKVGKEEGVGSVVRRLREETDVSLLLVAYPKWEMVCRRLTNVSSTALAALSHTAGPFRQDHARECVACCAGMGEGQRAECVRL